MLHYDWQYETTTRISPLLNRSEENKMKGFQNLSWDSQWQTILSWEWSVREISTHQINTKECQHITSSGGDT